MTLSENRRALSGIMHGGETPLNGEFLDAGGPFLATAKLIWEWLFCFSRPFSINGRNWRAYTACHLA